VKSTFFETLKSLLILKKPNLFYPKIIINVKTILPKSSKVFEKAFNSFILVYSSSIQNLMICKKQKLVPKNLTEAKLFEITNLLQSRVACF